MWVDPRSRLFVAYTTVLAMVAVGLVARARGDEMNAWYVGFLVLAGVVGLVIGTTIRSRSR